MQPLMLTSKELYYALTFLEIDQIRTLLQIKRQLFLTG